MLAVQLPQPVQQPDAVPADHGDVLVQRHPAGLHHPEGDRHHQQQHLHRQLRVLQRPDVAGGEDGAVHAVHIQAEQDGEERAAQVRVAGVAPAQGAALHARGAAGAAAGPEGPRHGAGHADQERDNEFEEDDPGEEHGGEQQHEQDHAEPAQVQQPEFQKLQHKQ